MSDISFEKSPEGSVQREETTERDADILNSSDEKTKAKRVRRKRKEKDISKEILMPLKIAAEQIASMLCSLSGDEELFVQSQDERPCRRVDTKTLKEFSSVIKEITGVICELNGITPSGSCDSQCAVKIEFDSDAEECSR